LAFRPHWGGKIRRSATNKKATKDGYQSTLDRKIGLQLKAAGVEALYEGFRIPWVPKPKYYKPDFLILHNGIVLEGKGYWITGDRQKIRCVHEQHPDIDLRVILATPHKTISKQSETTYSQFCEHIGVPWAELVVPDSWITAPPNEKSLAAVKRLMEAKK
jgi:hypothetical protein